MWILILFKLNQYTIINYKKLIFRKYESHFFDQNDYIISIKVTLFLTEEHLIHNRLNSYCGTKSPCNNFKNNT